MQKIDAADLQRCISFNQDKPPTAASLGPDVRERMLLKRETLKIIEIANQPNHAPRA